MSQKSSRFAACLLAGLLTLGGARAAAGNQEPALALHLLPVTINGVCTRSAAHPACGEIITSGRLTPTRYFAYVLVTGAFESFGVAGVEFGIDYSPLTGQGVDVFEWRPCGTLQFPSSGWPASGTGNIVTWDPNAVCQRDEPGGAGSGIVATAGYFYVAAYSPDLLKLTPRPVSGVAQIADCAAVEIPIERNGVPRDPSRLGYAAFSADGLSPGYNPCATAGTPLQCGISGPNSLPAGSTGALYVASSSRPNVTWSWSLDGPGTLTVQPPGDRVLVDAPEVGTLTLNLSVTTGGLQSKCKRVVTVVPDGCAVNGPGTLPSGHIATYTLGGFTPGAGIQWSVFGSGTIVGPADGVSVDARGGSPGLMTLQAAVTVGAETDTCARRIDITPGSCAIIGQQAVLAGATNLHYSVSTDLVGGHFSWEVGGNGSIVEGGDDSPEIVVHAGDAGSFTLTVHISDGTVERSCGLTVNIVGAGDCTTSRNIDARALLHLVPAGDSAPCDRLSAAPNCSNVRTNGTLNPQRYYAFLLVAQADALYGVGGLSCRIEAEEEQAGALHVFDWNLCADSQLPSDGWPAPGGGNRILWDAAHCQRREPGGSETGVVAAAGYFYLTAYAPARLQVRPLLGEDTIVVRDCLGCATEVGDTGGSVVFSEIGLENGFNPCRVIAPVTRVSWSSIKALYRR